MIYILLIASVFANSIVDKINTDPTSTWVAREYPREVITRAKMMSRIGMKLNPHKGEKYIPRNDIPESFDARIQWGAKILPVRDQGSCGSCWAFSLAECVGDRLGVAGQGRGDMSPQDLVSCDTSDKGCNGGEFETAWSWVRDHGIATEECLAYASSSGSVPSCPSKCNNGSEINRTKISSYKQLTVNEAQEAIMTKGPISAGFTVYLDFEFYSSGVYQHKIPIVMGGHAILIIGWGVDNGTPYWLCQNSWGSSWGESGHFRILRGFDESEIEDNLYAGEL